MRCTRTVTVDQPVSWTGEPCPDCGHTMLAHPGIINLTLDACLVCDVQASVQQLRDASAQAGLELADWQADALARIIALEARP